PALPEYEALAMMVTELAVAVRGGTAPPTDGSSALRVLDVLEAASASLAEGGVHTGLRPGPADEARTAPTAPELDVAAVAP
ncbi:MAG: hypothetical protein ACTHW7_14230, partial [Actinomycetaceae bacterium]